MGVELALLVTFAWFGGFLSGWGFNGMRLTKQHVRELRDIRDQLVQLRRVD